MSGTDAAPAALPNLRVLLAVVPEGIRVAWRLDGAAFAAREPLATIPLTIAGAPTVELDDDSLSASDDAGALRLVRSVEDDADGDPVHLWRAERATLGTVEVAHLARPDPDEPRPATPPLELRREATGLSGALKCFVVLPPGPADLWFELRWEEPGAGEIGEGWMFVSSLGEGTGRDGQVSGTGLERLADTYVMCGDLREGHHRDGRISTWWLTPPGIDVDAFGARLGTTYGVMATAFDAPAHPYRVFLRTHPHRGANASAHPASFVMAMNPADPLEESKVYETVAHELVHEWLHLDGPVDEVRWFVEGAADYYSLVLPLREGLVDEDAFLRAVNQEARTGFANPRRQLTLSEASPLFFTDFFAHWLPYVRGMFYLADLDARLREASSGAQSVDDVVRDVVRRRREGDLIGVGEWCAVVARILSGDERQVLDALVFTGSRGPGPGTFGPRFELTQALVPVLDVGFDPYTFVTRRVRGLVPGGPADRAGLREDDAVELPSYPDALALAPDDVLEVRAIRNGQTSLHTIRLGGQAVAVPQWRQPRSGAR